MPKKLTTKEDLLKALTNEKIFSKYQLSFYYNFERTVDTSLLDDFEVMKTIIENIPHSYQYVKYTHLKDNRDLVLLAIEHSCDQILKYAATKFRSDREIIEKIIKDGNNIEDVTYFSKEFLNDVEFMANGCSVRPSIYKYLPGAVKNNEKVLNSFINAAQKAGLAYLCRDLPERYLNNKEFILSFITDKKSAEIYKILIDEFKKDYDIAFKAAQFIGISIIENDEVKDDFDIVANSVKNSSYTYIYASERLKNDERIFNIILEENLYDWSIYQTLPDKFKQRKEILLRFDPEMVDFEDYLKDVSPSLQKDPDVANHFGSNEVVSVDYFWYHGFYTDAERKRIKTAINNHDYDTFMEMYNKKGRGLPRMADGHNEKEALIFVDITIKENFMKITHEESEAG